MSGSIGSAPSRADEASLEHRIGVLLTYRRLIVRLGAGAAILAVIWGSIGATRYTSESVIVPQVRGTAGGIGGLAAQLGLAAGGSEGGYSAAFYAALAESRPMLDSLALTRLTDDGQTSAMAPLLLDRLGVGGRSEAERRANGVKAMERAVAATVHQRTGTVRLAVSLPTPGLARGANAHLLELLNRFNVESRQSQARAERVFAERRREEVAATLAAAEERMQSFLERNRAYRNAPGLSFQYERLAREVELQRQLYASVVQALEQARIDEVRDTPVFTILQQPVEPAFPDPRRRVRNALLALVAGLMAGAVVALGVAYLNEETPVSKQEMAALVQSARADLLRPWRLLVGRSRGIRGGEQA